MLDIMGCQVNRDKTMASPRGGLSTPLYFKDKKLKISIKIKLLFFDVFVTLITRKYPFLSSHLPFLDFHKPLHVSHKHPPIIKFTHSEVS